MYANEPSAHFAIGRILLSQEQGIESLKKAMDVKADFTLPSCQLIYNFLMARGREKEAEPYYQRAVRYAEGLPNR
jgi:tetratricopeptide (TPR) repeat protein